MPLDTPPEVMVFKGIKLHYLYQFPLLVEFRQESVKESLQVLYGGANHSNNQGYYPRTTHLYKANLDLFSKIVELLENDPNFSDIKIVHKSSDLGLTHHIQAEYLDGSILFYDGLLIKVTKIIYNSRFNISELLSLTGCSNFSNDAINSFFELIEQKIGTINRWGYSTCYYYTIDEINWDRLGLQRVGNPQILLKIIDPSRMIITSSDTFKNGQFNVYLGEEDVINQMICQDFFIGLEIKNYTQFYNEQLEIVNIYQNRLREDFGGLISSIFKILHKHRSWNEVKNALISLFEIKEYLERGTLLLRDIQYQIEKKGAFYNTPRQIWFGDEEKDCEEKIPRCISQFFIAKINDDKIEIQTDNEKNLQSEFHYLSEFYNLKNNILHLKDLVEKIYKIEHDLLTGYQTEFAIYAVWIAIVALLITLLFQVAECVISVL